MSTYLFVYRHSNHQARSLSAGPTLETIAASGAFFQLLEPSLEDMGNPIFARATVGECGEDTVLGGYSLITADSLDEAVALASECWLIEHDGGVEVGELTRLNQEHVTTSFADHPIAQAG